MQGPIPKPPALRQRTNKTSTRAHLVVVETERKRTPRLPKLEGVEWHKMTRSWWRDVWRSPMSSEYLDADIHNLYRLAVLVNDFWTSPTKERAAEIRLQQQAFGLTPIDRRRLQWEVEKVESVTKKRSQTRERTEQGDPREALKVLAK